MLGLGLHLYDFVGGSPSSPPDEVIDVGTLGNPTYIEFNMAGRRRADLTLKDITKSPAGTRSDYLQFGTESGWLDAANATWRFIVGSNNSRSQDFFSVPPMGQTGSSQNSVVRLFGFNLDNGRPGAFVGRVNDQHAEGIGVIVPDRYTRFRIFTSSTLSVPDGTTYAGGTIYIQRR